MKSMKTKLSKEEKEILESFEKGEWNPVTNLSERKKVLSEYARNTLKKTGVIDGIEQHDKGKFRQASAS